MFNQFDIFMIDLWIKIAFKKVLYIIKTIFHESIYLLISVSNSWIKTYEKSK